MEILQKFFSDPSSWMKWAIAIGVATLAYSILRYILHSLFVRLRSRVRPNSHPFDNAILDALRGPLQMLAIAAAVAAGFHLGPEIVRAHTGAAVVIRVLFLIPILRIADRSVSTAIRTEKILRTATPSLRFLVGTATRITLYVIFILTILDTLGVSITPILASLGVGSVAIALALQDTLSNLFGGIYLLIDRPIRIGDFVRLDADTEGTVHKIGLRSTKILLPAGNMVTIPNAKLSTSQFLNYDMPARDTEITVQVGVAYECDLEHVERVTMDVANSVQGSIPEAVKGFEPRIRIHTFADSSINFSVVLKAAHISVASLVKHTFFKALHARYRSENIDIPFPQRVVHMQPSSVAGSEG